MRVAKAATLKKKPAPPARGRKVQRPQLALFDDAPSKPATGAARAAPKKPAPGGPAAKAGPVQTEPPQTPPPPTPQSPAKHQREHSGPQFLVQHPPPPG